MSQISYLSNLRPEMLTELSVLLKDEFFKQGREIFLEGDPCQSVILIT